MSAELPAAARPYGELVVAAARECLEAVAVYAVGSLALGDWSEATSDVDVAVVTAELEDAARLTAFAERVADGAGGLPPRRLEIVVYAAERVARGDATFSLNLNVERDGTHTADLDPKGVPRFWFVLDLAIAAAHAVPLWGGAELAAPPDGEVRAALDGSVAWFADDGDPEAALLARCRALHWVRTGTWASKTASAEWAAGELPALAPALGVLVARRRSDRRP